MRKKVRSRRPQLCVRESRSMLSRKLSRVLSFLFDSTRRLRVRVSPFFPLKDYAWLGISPDLCTAYTDATRHICVRNVCSSQPMNPPTYNMPTCASYALPTPKVGKTGESRLQVAYRLAIRIFTIGWVLLSSHRHDATPRRNGKIDYAKRL